MGLVFALFLIVAFAAVIYFDMTNGFLDNLLVSSPPARTTPAIRTTSALSRPQAQPQPPEQPAANTNQFDD